MWLPAPARRLTALALLSLLDTTFAADGRIPAVPGLGVETTDPASCTRSAQPGDTLSVAYRGVLVDGTEFDSSAGGPPITFKLGVHEVIRGWDYGLVGMCIGESRRLTIAPELAYGNQNIPGIPPGSTLIFDTTLEAIRGVEKEEPGKAKELPHPAPPTGVIAELKGSDGKPRDPPPSGKCQLLGPFAILIQGALGALALLALVVKRYREHPRRPVKIWAFDVSKQVVGSVLLHMANLFMSMLSSGDFDIKAMVASDAEGNMPNPCSFYLLNLAIDTTIGIPILVLLLRIIHILFGYTPLANPPESIKSGNYGHPARVTWWLKQSFLYFLGLFGMKFCVFVLFQLLPWLGWIGDWALRWTEGNEALQIIFVMLVFPVIMNALQYWIIDSFIKDPAGSWQEEGEEQRREGDDEDDENDEHQGLMGGAGGRHSEDGEEDDDVKSRRIDAKGLKEVNPTPIPAYSSSSGSSADSRKYEEEDDKHT